MCCLNTFCHQFCNLSSASISLYASVKLVKHAFMRLNCILSHSRWFMPSPSPLPSWNLIQCFAWISIRTHTHTNSKVYYVHLRPFLTDSELSRSGVFAIVFCLFVWKSMEFISSKKTCATAADALRKIQYSMKWKFQSVSV